MPTVGEIFERERGVFGSVPSVTNDFVCRYCLGPVSPEFNQCFGCFRLLLNPHPVAGEDVYAPPEIQERITPATTVLNPSPWYSYLATYKRGRLEEYGPVLAALAYTYLDRHTARIADLLGGPLTQLAVVPSKRGYVFGDQPLVKALSIVQPLRDQLGHLLDYVQGSNWGRQEYHPDAFRAGPTRIAGKRIALLEDAWVTGATAVSAAGALLREGAAGVVILPLARVVNLGYLPDATHPYRQAMAAPYDPDHWPREEPE